MKVIGLGHRARHGKDTVAAAMIRDVASAMRFSFADDLYAYCRIQYGMTTKDAPLLQRVGVEMREKDPAIWVKSVYSKMLDAMPRLAIITDVRFPNEMEFVRKLGGTCVRVLRFNSDGTPFVDPSRPADHISEVALRDADWDVTIAAMSGDVYHLQRAATVLADDVLAPRYAR